MDALRQRLKELDASTFQDLCFQILSAKHPGLKLKHVAGAGGDQGLDVFEGELSGRPTIWQSKSFPDGVRGSQKQQIKESLKTALKHFSPQGWVLCLSVDLDSKSHQWFERLEESRKSEVSIGLFSASGIILELIHRRSIRNHFFPDLALDLVAVKRLLTATESRSLEELETLTETNLEDLLERWKERDPRCDYQLIFDGDMGPSAPRHTNRPGLIMSFSTGFKTLHVFARDIEGLRSYPPSFKISITGTGAEKIREAIRTGARKELNPGEIVNFTSDWPVLASLLQNFNASRGRLQLGPADFLPKQQRSVRVTFSRRGGGESIVYDLMIARPLRLGSEEAELVCSGKNLPFEIAIEFPTQPLMSSTERKVQIHGRGKINIRKRPIGASFTRFKKFLDAMALLQPAGEIEIIDLQEEQLLFRAECELSDEDFLQDDYRRFVSDVARIADQFKADLRIPSNISDSDLYYVRLLKTLIEGGCLPLDDISATLVKSEENKNVVPEQLAINKAGFRFTHKRHEPRPILFGATVDTGPFGIEVEAIVRDSADVIKRFREAAIGDDVRISFRPTGPARFFLIPGEEFSGAGLGIRPSNPGST